MIAFYFPHYLQGETLIQILSPPEIKKKTPWVTTLKESCPSMEIESRLISDCVGLGERRENGE